MENLVQTILEKKSRVVFVSPHLDDAVLSCGALMRELSGKVPVTVVTVFTDAGEKPETLSVKAFLRQCGVSDAHRLFALRRGEDETACRALGVEWEHLGLPDAMWRKRPAGMMRRALGRLMPEFVHVYPVYRWQVTAGKVSDWDQDTVDQAERMIREVVGESEDAVVFFPLGLGGHVDHALVHSLGVRFADRVVYYADFPYCLTDKPDIEGLAKWGMKRFVFDKDIASKHPLILMYATQRLFNGEIPTVPEEYFVSGEKSLF